VNKYFRGEEVPRAFYFKVDWFVLRRFCTVSHVLGWLSPDSLRLPLVVPTFLMYSSRVLGRPSPDLLGLPLVPCGGL